LRRSSGRDGHREAPMHRLRRLADAPPASAGANNGTSRPTLERAPLMLGISA
jgi:hypothetical protein